MAELDHQEAREQLITAIHDTLATQRQLGNISLLTPGWSDSEIVVARGVVDSDKYVDHIPGVADLETFRLFMRGPSSVTIIERTTPADDRAARIVTLGGFLVLYDVLLSEPSETERLIPPAKKQVGYDKLLRAMIQGAVFTKTDANEAVQDIKRRPNIYGLGEELGASQAS